MFSVQPITKFFILLQKISNSSHKKKSNPTGQPKFLDALFSDNSCSYVLPFTCIIEALNSSLKSGTVLQVSLVISQNKKYELRTNLASKRQKRILTILLDQRSFEVCLPVIFTVASFLTKNSLNQQEIGVFIYTIA